MGRGKLAMQLITKEKARTATFLKRKKSLFKKASELSILCDVNVCVIVNWLQNTDPLKAKSETWPENSDDVAKIIASYKAENLNGRCKTASNLSTFFLDGQRKADNKARAVDKMVIKAKFPDWDHRLNCFSGEELFKLLHVIDRKIAVVDQQLNTLVVVQAPEFSIVDQHSGPEQVINCTALNFQPHHGDSGINWGREYPETVSNLGVLEQGDSGFHLQMQPQMEFPVQLIDYPAAVTPLQTWPPPLLPNPSIQRMPFLPRSHAPWPEFVNGCHYQMDDDYEETFSTINGFCNFRGF